jgi:hypothetical protein
MNAAIEPPPTVAPAAVRPRPTLWKKLLANRFLFISILVNLLLGLGATVFIVQRFQATRKLTFKGGPPSPNPSTRSIEHKVQMAKKQSTMSAPAIAKRITTTGMAKVTLPEMPAMPQVTNAPTKMIGAGGTGSAASLGAAGPMNSGAPSGGGATMFGLRSATGGGIAGHFYDLKQTQSHGPTGMTPQKWATEVTNFVMGSWNEGQLAKFFKGPTTLYTTQIFIPDMPAEAGPSAFQVDKEVQPRMWLAHYKGSVIAPETGAYHFVGAGDDILIVRFGGRLVLCRGWDNPKFGIVKTNWHAQANYNYGFTNIPEGFAKGDKIEMRAGDSYPIEVLIGEQPGGRMFATLLIEKEGVTYEKDSKGNPILPAFRMSDSKLPDLQKGQSYPPHQEGGPIWRATSAPKSPFSR